MPFASDLRASTDGECSIFGNVCEALHSEDTRVLRIIGNLCSLIEGIPFIQLFLQVPAVASLAARRAPLHLHLCLLIVKTLPRHIP